jgi:uncharacterized protein YjbI with pentapeptide repeats
MKAIYLAIAALAANTLAAEPSRAEPVSFFDQYVDQETIRNIDLNGANFHRALIHAGTSFYRREMNRASFQNLSNGLNEVSFQEARLRGANFYDLGIYETNFYLADLRGANFQNASLTYGRTETTLQGADLRGANFYDAFFYKVNLRYAKLEGADLRARALYQTALTGATFDDATKLPFSKQEALARGMIYQPSGPQGSKVEQEAGPAKVLKADPVALAYERPWVKERKPTTATAR